MGVCWENTAYIKINYTLRVYKTMFKVFTDVVESYKEGTSNFINDYKKKIDGSMH
jgi:hypothetical protein